MSHQPTLSGRTGFIRSILDHKTEDPYFFFGNIRKRERPIAIPDLSWLGPPPWLSGYQPNDRILDLVGYLGIYRSVLPQSVFYRELYSEAFAYQHLGEAFLASWRAYNDLNQHGVLSDRALKFLIDSGVTVIVLNPAKPQVEQDLVRRWPWGVQKPNLAMLRLNRPPD